MSNGADEGTKNQSGRPEGDATGTGAGARSAVAGADGREPKTVDVSAFDLRAMAEAADGRRGRIFKIVDNPGGRRKAKVVEAGAGDEEVLLRIKAAKRVSVPKEEGFFVRLPADIRLPDGVARPKDDDYIATFDALFWSESAVDKFVAPYYIHMMTLAELQATLQPYYDDPKVVAMAHLPDSEVVGTGPGDDPLPGLFAVTAVGAKSFTLVPVQQQRR